MLKKLLTSFLLGLTIFLSFAPYLSSVKAQEWYSQDPFEWYLKVYDKGVSPPNEIFGERYTAAQVQWVVYSVVFIPVRMVESVVGESAVSCFMKQFGTGAFDISTCGNAIFDFMGKIVDFIPNLVYTPVNNNQSLASAVFNSSNREISGIGYTKNLLNKLSPVSEVKAQGVGYAGLTWIQSYWKGFRDIAYALLVLVVIVFAFMIMFRVKLSPQTVISVQSALPKVIVAIVLVTFSYAIAGFAIDLMYVVAGLFALLLKYAGFSTDINAAWGTISGTGWGYALAGGFWVLFEMIGYTILFFIAGIVVVLTTLVAGANIFGMILGVVFMLIAVGVLIIGLWYTIKIPYVLLKTLISVYLSIITAPLQILAGTISPSLGFGSWFKRLMSDILVFPVVGLLLWFAWATLFQAYAQAGLDVERFWNHLVFQTDWSTAWVPEIIGSRAIGGHNSGISGIIMLAISLGMITLIPKVPELLKGIFMGEKFSFGTAMGEAAGPISGITKGVGGAAQGAAVGGGAIWVGGRLERSGRKRLNYVGKIVSDYGNKTLGRNIGQREGVTSNVNPSEANR